MTEESPVVCETTIREALSCRSCESLVSACDECTDYFGKPEDQLICIDYGEEHYHPECWEEKKKRLRNEKEMTQ